MKQKTRAILITLLIIGGLIVIRFVVGKVSDLISTSEESTYSAKSKYSSEESTYSTKSSYSSTVNSESSAISEVKNYNPPALDSGETISRFTFNSVGSVTWEAERYEDEWRVWCVDDYSSVLLRFYVDEDGFVSPGDNYTADLLW